MRTKCQMSCYMTYASGRFLTPLCGESFTTEPHAKPMASRITRGKKKFVGRSHDRGRLVSRLAVVLWARSGLWESERPLREYVSPKHPPPRSGF